MGLIEAERTMDGRGFPNRHRKLERGTTYATAGTGLNRGAHYHFRELLRFCSCLLLSPLAVGVLQSTSFALVILVVGDLPS